MGGKFEPKTPVQLDPPKDDPISAADLAQADGVDGNKCYVAIKGKVYDVTGNKAYQPGGSYNVFAGKDASRALGKTSTKPEDVSPEWQDLDDKEKSTLEDWVTFFSKRYNVSMVMNKTTYDDGLGGQADIRAMLHFGKGICPDR
ncbi:cytochrome b5-like heme/Steroid binding domain-containing protein [Sarocladium implicatum]|nr:cytochrome b5-like heme/Steroid binding domain-containing protein [Sarocladium implicatum]